ncbi:hypothetical protein PR048_008558 [Dryococelus australis]|uniref:Uncharacterized protein n=1 Tax=Dryococelus australis TaxID=614101 RepID=A0ABQ9HXG8_9NEOP|nr:hypothetical protein PR048_008558 [Dryococelus australis]
MKQQIRKDKVCSLFSLKILAACTEHTYFVAGTKVLTNTNSKECSQASVDILVKLDIKYNIISFTCDSAKYMTKCVEVLLLGTQAQPSWRHLEFWFHVVEYIDTYFPHLFEYFTREDADDESNGSSIELFWQMSSDKVAVVKCEARFVVEHLNQLLYCSRFKRIFHIHLLTGCKGNLLI